MALTQTRGLPPCFARDSSRGFSLLEVLMAMIVLTVGLIGLVGLFGYDVATLQLSRDRMIAKQKARDALESIYTARNTQQVTFNMIQNAGNGGIFLDGLQPLGTPGADGLVDTADDGEVEVIYLPGPDGTLGTGDDESRSLTNFQRQIFIQPIAGSLDLRQVTITVQFSTPSGLQDRYEVKSYVSRFR